MSGISWGRLSEGERADAEAAVRHPARGELRAAIHEAGRRVTGFHLDERKNQSFHTRPNSSFADVSRQQLRMTYDHEAIARAHELRVREAWMFLEVLRRVLQVHQSPVRIGVGSENQREHLTRTAK